MPLYTPPASAFGIGFASAALASLTGTAEQSLIPAALGYKGVPANWFRVGRTVRLVLAGDLTNGLTPPTATIKVKLGGVVIASGSAGSLLSLSSGGGFELVERITCMSVGVAGSIVASGRASYAASLTGSRSSVDLNQPTPQTIDTTIDQALDATVQFAASATPSTIRIITAFLEMPTG